MSELVSSWKPEPGDTLEGHVVEIRNGEAQYGPAQIAVIETQSGIRYALWLASTVLKALWEQQAPQVGDRVSVAYSGKHPDKNYHMFELTVDHTTEWPAKRERNCDSCPIAEVLRRLLTGALIPSSPHQDAPPRSRGGVDLSRLQGARGKRRRLDGTIRDRNSETHLASESVPAAAGPPEPSGPPDPNDPFDWR